MSVNITQRLVGDVLILDAKGRITIDEGADSLRVTFRNVVESGQTKVVLNLTDTFFMDSVGLGDLMSGFTALNRQGGNLKLLALNKRVKDFIQMTRLYTVFEVYETEADAVRSFT